MCAKILNGKHLASLPRIGSFNIIPKCNLQMMDALQHSYWCKIVKHNQIEVSSNIFIWTLKVLNPFTKTAARNCKKCTTLAI